MNEINNQMIVLDDPIDKIIEDEDSEETRELLDLLKECKMKLSPRDIVILEMYFTGIEIVSEDDKPVSGKELVEIRKKIAKKFGISPEAIRTIARRSKAFVSKCMSRRMMQQSKNN